MISVADASDALLTVAEVAIALAASTGIILAVTRGTGSWRPFDSIRVAILLVLTLGTTVFAFVPLVLSFGGVEAGTVWRLSSALLALFTVANSGGMSLRLVALPREARADFRPLVATVLLLSNAVVVALLVWNAFRGSLALYFAGLLWNLVESGLIFILIIFVRPRAADE